MMKRVMSLAALALAGATLTACGSSAPTDASKDDFCEAFTEAATDWYPESEDEEIDTTGAIETLEETGTPEDIGEDARNGFEVYIDALDEINGNSIADYDGEDPVEVSEDDEADFDALSEYVTQECGGSAGGVEGGADGGAEDGTED
ncbi:hypothetical protein RDV89_08995 [Nocardioides zeae]|uniref:Uncharacterized protein n=1 Tax=Nocardioides imazamoxiresistens TaxID=3231893 RepID=A0ABU3PVF8_9ACTN|nr:hypothetical protein [Nocardioides zeae]MDT9593203.1 hypothetical protein [Nocardioides zeae]